MKKKFDQFLDSPVFVAFIAVLVCACWRLNIFFVGAIIFCLLASYIFLFRADNLKPLMVMVCLGSFMMHHNVFDIPKAYAITVFVCAGITAFSIIWHLVYNYAVKRKEFKCGGLAIGFVTAGFVTFISGLFRSDYEKKYIPIVLLICIAFYLAYFFFVNGVKADKRKFIANMIIVAACIAIYQMISYYLHVEDILFAFQGKTMRIGWGMTNSISCLLVLAIPMCYWYMSKSKYPSLWLLLAIIIAIANLFTFSRGNILISIPICAFCLIYGFIKSDRKIEIALAFCTYVIFIAVAILLLDQTIVKIFGRVLDLGISDNGRFDLWKYAIKLFKEEPMLGVGFFGEDGSWVVGNIRGFHCTPIQILASTGLVGVLGFVVFYFQKYKIMFSGITKFKVFAIAALLMNALYGLIDINMFIVFEILLTQFLIAAIEQENNSIKQLKSQNMIIASQNRFFKYIKQKLKHNNKKTMV